MSSVSIALNIVANNMGGGVFANLLGNLGSIGGAASTLGTTLGNTSITLGELLGGMAGAGAALGAFLAVTKSATTQSSDLEFALVQMDIAIGDSAQHAPALSQAVIDIGNSSIFTHTQVAQLFTALGEMGFTSAQILGGVGQAATNMAIAMNVDGVTAAHLLGQAMNSYQIPVADATHTTDILTRSMYDSGVGADGLQQAMSMAAGQAKVSGLSFQDFMTTIDLMSKSMGSGSKAGTSLRYMLASMDNPVTKAANELDNLGIITANKTSPAINDLMLKIMGASTQAALASGTWDGTVGGLNNIYIAGQKAGKIPMSQSFHDWATASDALNNKLNDSSGHFLGMKNAIDLIIGSLKGMDPDQIQAVMGALFNVRGGQGAEQMVNLLGQFDSKYNQVYTDIGRTGTAQDAANKLLETAQGRWQQMGTTMNSFMSQVGGPINGVLKNIYLGVNNLISAMSKDGNVKMFTTAFLVAGVAVSALALVIGAILVAVVLAGTAIGAVLLPVIGVALGVFAALVVVAALVAGAFVLIKTHGQDFLNAIKPVTDFIGSVFTKSLHDITGAMAPIDKSLMDLAHTAQAQLMPAWNQLVAAFKPYIPVLLEVAKWVGIVLGALVGIIAAGVIATLIGLINALIQGFVGLVSGIIVFVSGAVTTLMGFFSFGLDIFSGFFRLLGDMFTGQWGRLGHDTLDILGKLGNDIITILKGIGMMAWGIFQGFIGLIIGLVGGFVTGIVGFFQGLADTLVGHSIIPDMVNAIFSWFQKLPGLIGGIFSGLAKSALSWGSDLIGNIIGGIQSMAGNLTNAVGNVAQTIKNFLHFSKPDEGPLSDADTYGGDFIQLLAGGMTGSLGTLRGAAGQVASTLANGVTATGLPMSGGTGGGQGTVTIPVYLDSKLVGQAVLDMQKKTLRTTGAARMFR